MVVTYTHGFITRQEVTGLLGLWSDAAAALRTVTIPTWQSLMAAVRELVFPYSMNVKLAEVHRQKMRKARKMVQDIAALACDRPGVLAWAENMARELRLKLRVTVPEDYTILSPVRERSDWQKAEDQQARAARGLAVRWSEKDPDTVSDRIVYLEREAAVAGVHMPAWTHYVCCEIASNISTPLRWAESLMRSGARCELIGPFLGRALAVQADGLPEIASRCLENPAYKAIGAGDRVGDARSTG